MTLCEIAWVLAEAYGSARDAVHEVIEKLLTTKQLSVESADLVWKALKRLEATSADFADALIGEISRAEGASKTVTFDRPPRSSTASSC